jgi:hypothetical protein
MGSSPVVNEFFDLIDITIESPQQEASLGVVQGVTYFSD